MEKQVPNLRFPGFDKYWEKKKIDGSIEFLTGFPFKGEDISEDSSGLRLMRGVNISEGEVRHSTDIDRYYKGDVSKLEKYFVKDADVVIGMDGSKVGRNSAVIGDSDSNALLVQRVARLREKQGYCLPFIFQHINSIIFHRYVDEVKTSSGIPHISAKQITDFLIFFPDIPEQQKIAAFFTAIDEKLQALRKKQSLLEAYKKGVMQRLFSQELRFKDEDGTDFPEWKEKKLGEIADVKGGKRIPKGYGLQERNNGYPYITVSDMENGSVSVRNIRYVPIDVTGQIKNYKISTKDIYVSVAGTLGLVGIIPSELENANLTENANKLTNLQCNQAFLLQLLKSDAFAKLIENVSTVGAQPKLAIYALSGFICPLPSDKEQTKIANSLSALDEKLSQCSRQIAQTEQWKRGLMQRMFC